MTAKEILKKEYPTIYNAYKEIADEQFELFAKKHLDYGMGNVSAGTQLVNKEEEEFAMTGLWYRLSDKINRWKNMIRVALGQSKMTRRPVAGVLHIIIYLDLSLQQQIESNNYKK